MQHTYASAGTYNVQLSVTDNDNDTESTSRAVTITDDYAADSFTRTVANGLGTADNGGPWTIAGTASSFGVNNGAGRIAGAVAANRAAYLAVQRADVDIRNELSLNLPSTGGGAYVSVIGRRVSNGNDYRLKLRYMPDKTVVAYLARTVGGVETILANTTVPGLSVNPNDVLRTRFVVSGSPNTTVSAKVWRKGTQEPTAWLLTNTSATPAQLQAPGDIGVLVYVSGSWTGSCSRPSRSTT